MTEADWNLDQKCQTDYINETNLLDPPHSETQINIPVQMNCNVQ